MSSPLQLTISDYVAMHLRMVSVIIPLIISILFAFGVALVVIWVQVREAKVVISTVNDHIASLLEIQDSPEIHRLLTSLKNFGPIEPYLVQNGRIIASTQSLGDYLRPMPPFKGLHFSQGLAFNAYTIKVSESVQRSNGPTLNTELVLFIPFNRAGTLALVAWLATFLVGILISGGYLILTRRALTLALKPLEMLNNVICSLSTERSQINLAPLGIIELDQIRRTVSKTQSDLFATRERLVVARAKELAADSYRRLIHDLHTPVACLTSVVALTQENPDDKIIQEDARVRIPRLASQILAQLSTALHNNEFEEPRFAYEDIRLGVTEAKDQMAFIIASQPMPPVIETNLPDEPILVHHDRILFIRVISNLIKNSVEAGANHIIVSMKTDKESVSIWIEDSGVGLPEKDIALYLSGRGRSSKRDRFAIGLSTVNNIVRSHGGRIIYRRSAALGGACFEVRICTVSMNDYFA